MTLTLGEGRESKGALAMKLSKLGVWAGMDAFTATEAAAFAQRVEGWGYGALWIPEAMGRNSLVHAAWLLANTSTLVIATGIANIYARDWVAASSAQKALNEQSGGRFLLGLGVSHTPLVEGFRGADFADGGSDRLVDAIVAWGDDEAIRARLRSHWDAGADHVCIQALGGPGKPFPKPDEELLKRFAPGA